ncbi:MAG: bifunctional riboflavin kinase/FAD synthetase [Endomicrobiaceae bacterium]|nr:bifunctional riboflavin kinase/FAD synthetase [Endomicrobiaceae bacterium]
MKQSVITIGTFDGVHKGHKAIIDKVIEISKTKNLKSILISFEKPIKQVNGLLTLPDEKIEILSSFIVDEIIILPVDKSIVSITAENFFNDVLLKQLHANHIVVGYDCAFGKDRVGNILWLQKKAKQHNISIDIIKPVKVRKQIISSSKIRSLIQKDNISLANQMLDRVFEINGKKISGNKIGREIGFPTINIKVNQNKVLPRGIFICSIVDKTGQIYPGVLNIGTRPTVKLKNHALSIEIHLLGFSGTWKEKDIKVSIYKYIRNERKFTSLDYLKKAIRQDIVKAKHFFSL